MRSELSHEPLDREDRGYSQYQKAVIPQALRKDGKHSVGPTKMLKDEPADDNVEIPGLEVELLEIRDDAFIKLWIGVKGVARHIETYTMNLAVQRNVTTRATARIERANFIVTQ